MKHVSYFVLLAAVMALAIPAEADLIDYQIGSGSVSAREIDPGLVIQHGVLGGVAGRTFSLDDGDTEEFAFFEIWTNESDVGSDDLTGYEITATLSFDAPPGSAVITGETIGIRGWFQRGSVTWDGPAVVSTSIADFQVTLNDATFNWGFLSLSPGACWGATVNATVEQLSSSSGSPSVPAPAAAGLVLVGLGLVGSVKRRIS